MLAYLAAYLADLVWRVNVATQGPELIIGSNSKIHVVVHVLVWSHIFAMDYCPMW